MRYLLGEADGRIAKDELRRKKENPLSSYKFRFNAVIHDKGEGGKFKKLDVPIVFKVTPDSLLNLCARVVDAIPLAAAYGWSTEDICKWLREYGYSQYQNTFRKNLITGRNLLLLDASALAAMNITDFLHIRDITAAIRRLFHFGLYPKLPEDIYKLYRCQTGEKYNLRRSDLWRKQQVIRRKAPNYTHWDTLERWLHFEKQPQYKELIGGARRTHLY